MKTNYPASLAAVLKHEGGYSNNPKDPGGATMKGVTQAVYDAYRKRHGIPTAAVKGIDDRELQAIYKQQYWDIVRGDDLPSGLDYCVFDFAVNSGPGKSVEYLQSALGVKTDGVMGNITLHAADTTDARKTINEVCDRRLAFLKRLKIWSEFGKGWSARVAGVRGLAIDMLSKTLATQPAPLPPPPDVPPVEPMPPVATSKEPMTIQKLMAYIVAGIIAAIVAWLGWGR